MHSVFFQATLDVWPQMVQQDETVAERQARGNSAASVVDTLSIAWQAYDVVAWPTSAAAKPGAVAEMMFPSGQTAWYKVLELNVATASGTKVVCTSPVRVKGVPAKKLAGFLFGVGKGLHRSWSYPMYHEGAGRSVWYGLQGLQGFGVDKGPEFVMKAFAWVNERKESDVGAQGHTRGGVLEVEGEDEDEEDKEQPKDTPKDKDKPRTSQSRKVRTKSRARTTTRTRPKKPGHHGHRTASPSSPSSPRKCLTFGLMLPRWYNGARTPSRSTCVRPCEIASPRWWQRRCLTLPTAR